MLASALPAVRKIFCISTACCCIPVSESVSILSSLPEEAIISALPFSFMNTFSIFFSDDVRLYPNFSDNFADISAASPVSYAGSMPVSAM